MIGWDAEPEPRDEGRCTASAEAGWLSWNCKSPEVWFCEKAAELVREHQPAVVIETGVGQGYVTRRIEKALPEGSRLLCFESDPAWHRLLEGTGFFDNERLLLMARPPEAADFQAGGLCVLDSSFGQRKREIRLWKEHAPRGSVMLVHDVTERHDAAHVCRRLYDFIRGLDLDGEYLPNPRGGFLAVK
jgi:hypothetical protein